MAILRARFHERLRTAANERGLCCKASPFDGGEADREARTRYTMCLEERNSSTRSIRPNRDSPSSLPAEYTQRIRQICEREARVGPDAMLLAGSELEADRATFDAKNQILSGKEE